MTTDDALKLLGLARDASPDEIRKAHTRVVQQFHPDKFQHLAEEFRRIAERKTKEINEAFTLLKNYRPEEGSSLPPPPSSSPPPPPRKPRRPKADPTPPASSTPRKPAVKAIAVVGVVVVLLLFILLYVKNGGRESSQFADLPAKPQSPSYGNPAPTTHLAWDYSPLMWAELSSCGGEKAFGIGMREAEVLRILGPPQRTEGRVFVVDNSQSEAYTYGMVYSDITVLIAVIGDSKAVVGWWFPPAQGPPKNIEWCEPSYTGKKPRYFGMFSPLKDVMQLEGIPYYALGELDKKEGQNKLYLRYKGGSVTIDEYWFVSDYNSGGGLHTDERDFKVRFDFMVKEILRRDWSVP